MGNSTFNIKTMKFLLLKGISAILESVFGHTMKDNAAWDARREEHTKRPKPAYIDEVWPQQKGS